MGQIKDINDLVNATFQVKKFFKDTKKKYNLNYEEVYILNYIARSKTNEITSKEIAPYYLTKALQKLKDLQLLSKKRSVQDERIVIVYVTDEQRDKINKLIAELEKYIK